MSKNLVVIEGNYSVGASGIMAEWSLNHEDLMILGHSKPARDQGNFVIIAEVITIEDYNQHILKK